MEIIISLTSYPERINNVHEVIKTLLIQNKKPDKIILWLSPTQFLEKEKDLPRNLLQLTDFGLTIRWCEDLKPHKKYFYVMQEFPDDIVITVDDDVYYSPRLIEILYESYLKFPDAVSCGRANRIVIDKHEDTSYHQWEKSYRKCCNKKVLDLLPVGIGGVLYPPHCLPDETFNKDLINLICPYQDDLWLKAMEIKNNIYTVLVDKGELLVNEMKEGIEFGLYNTINHQGNNVAIHKIIKELDRQTGESNFLIRKLMSDKFTVNKLLQDEKKEKEKLEQKFIEDIKDKKLIIYGAGVGAHLVIECLTTFDSSLVPYAFVVTNKKSNPEYLFNIPVLNIDELNDEKSTYYIIVSTAERLHKEIGTLLNKLCFPHVVFIQDSIMGKLLSGKKDIFNAHESFIASLIENDKLVNNFDNN